MRWLRVGFMPEAELVQQRGDEVRWWLQKKQKEAGRLVGNPSSARIGPAQLGTRAILDCKWLPHCAMRTNPNLCSRRPVSGTHSTYVVSEGGIWG